MGSEETAQEAETPRALASRHHLSTQKMYELKTKLRCSSEECRGVPKQGRVGGPQGQHSRSGHGDLTLLVPSHRCGEPGHAQLPPLV